MSNKEESQSMIGRIIDLPLEKFNQELIDQKVNIGTMNNLKLNLIGVYDELTARKDIMILAITKGELDKENPEVQKALNGLYAELIKVEQKVLSLKEHVEDLLKLK